MAAKNRTKLPPQVRDLRGMKFGRLTVVRYAGRASPKGALWECACDCGTIHTTRGRSLTSGSTSSCGCLWLDKQADRSTIHGGKGTRIYGIWQGMLRRCADPRHDPRGRYATRGITVCDRWRDFEAFRADMGDPPAGMSIERVNNDGDYEPGNCRWATQKEQMRNTVKSHHIEFDGRRLTLGEWAERIDIRPSTLSNRIMRYGWSIEDALTMPAGWSPRKRAGRLFAK